MGDNRIHGDGDEPHLQLLALDVGPELLHSIRTSGLRATDDLAEGWSHLAHGMVYDSFRCLRGNSILRGFGGFLREVSSSR